MAGGHMKYRTLSRSSAHRKALLRNLVTSLVKLESISTTYAKAKEAQTLADKLITLAKRNNETARRSAQGILFTPDQLLPKLFGELRERYQDRPGGYTRVLRIEPLNRHNLDQAESAILEFVDGKVDTRFSMTAAAVARAEIKGWRLNPTTLLNIKKVTAFRKDGHEEFRRLVKVIKKQMPKGADKDASSRDEDDEGEGGEGEGQGAGADLDDYQKQMKTGKGMGRGARQRQRRAALRGKTEKPLGRRAAVRGGAEKKPSARRAPAPKHDDEWEDLEEASEAEGKARGQRSDQGRGAKRERKPAGNRHEKGRGREPTEPASF